MGVKSTELVTREEALERVYDGVYGLGRLSDQSLATLLELLAEDVYGDEYTNFSVVTPEQKAAWDCVG